MGVLGQISSIATVVGALVMGLMISLNPNFCSGVGGVLIIVSCFLFIFAGSKSKYKYIMGIVK